MLHPTLERPDAAPPLKCGLSNTDISRNRLGLPTPAKSDFDAIANFRGDASFKMAQ